METEHLNTNGDTMMSTNNNITINGDIVSDSVTVHEKHCVSNNKKVERFIHLNGNERQVMWNSAENGDSEDQSKNVKRSQLIKNMEQIQNAVNNTELTENTAGVIIFKDENGVAPPITIEILKNNNAQPASVVINNETSKPAEVEVESKLSQEFRTSVKLDIEPKSVLQVPKKAEFEDVDLNTPVIVTFPRHSEISKDKAPQGSETSLGRKQLRSIVDRKQEDRKKQFENIRVLKKAHGDDIQAILKLDWDKLVDQLQSRKLTAVQVLKAYQLKAVEATDFCNAVTEFNPKAMEMAEKLDKMTTVKGPLHGVPFCVKDDTNVEGMDSTLACAKRCYQPADASSVLVRALMDLGAVPFCKTNVPQTLLTYGSDNPVFGTTTSCHNKKLTAGGSSSGTGALVGFGGAMFGTGTDVGGSLRLPAHCNGVASIKPTAGRFSTRGIEGVLPNLMGMSVVSGIIGANPKVVGYVVRHLLIKGQLSQLDPLCLPIPWNEKIYSSKKPMRIGYFTGLEFFPPVGDTIEVVGRAVDALRTKGHTMVPISTLPDGKRIMRCASNFIMADGSRAIKKIFDGEEVSKSAELMSLASKAPMWAIKFFKFLMERKTLLPWIYSDLLASVLDAGSTRSYELWENNGECKQIREEILEEWSKLELDCCLCPVMPFPAPPLHVPGYLPIGCIYTMMWNVVEFPAGVVKFGEESGKNIDSYDTRGDQALKLAQKSCKESIGSPICVQVVALPFKDENVLRVMEELGESHP